VASAQTEPIDLGHACLESSECGSEYCCPAGDPREGLCGIPTGEECPVGNNNACCSQSCVEVETDAWRCRDRSAGVQGVTCDIGDQGDCADGFTCCDNYTDVGPDFYCTDTTSDPLNCGGCSQSGGRACPASESFCVDSLCRQCDVGYVVSPYNGECILEGTCPSGEAAECFGTNQVCCPDGSPKAYRCVGQGRDGGDRACSRGN
jgi:hypothetical protein